MAIDAVRPRLRSLEFKWIDRAGQRVLLIRDPTGIAPFAATVPALMAHLIGLFDGERDLSAIRAAFEIGTGQRLLDEHVEKVIQQLDEALFLDSPAFKAAQDVALLEYRNRPNRPATLADRVYPSDPLELRESLAGYANGESHAAPAPAVRGVVSPHIDYQRGGATYARTWRRAAKAVRNADLVIIFGTDHSGGPGKITLTHKSYATPLGLLPTATGIVDRLADAIVADEAYAEELHHQNEHSIELASIWLRCVSDDPPPRVVPILCGSFHEFTHGDENPAKNEQFERLLDALRVETDGRRVLVVASGDLAHVGPAFGDDQPLDFASRKRLAVADEHLLESVRTGDAEGFFNQLRAERDERRVCGLPPIYLMLRFVGPSDGTIVGYQQCPADSDGGSLVSIAGVLLD